MALLVQYEKKSQPSLTPLSRLRELMLLLYQQNIFFDKLVMAGHTPLLKKILETTEVPLHICSPIPLIN